MGGRAAKIKRCLGMCIVVAVVVWFASFALRNPDVTQTRLLLTYWLHYLVGLVAIAFGVLLAGEAI